MASLHSGVGGYIRDGLGGFARAGANALTSVDHNSNDVDPECIDGIPDLVHPGVCNGRERIELYGAGDPGDAVMILNMGIALHEDGGLCRLDPAIESFGPDGLPCTADDRLTIETRRVAITSGRAHAVIDDLDNESGPICPIAPCRTAPRGGEGRVFDYDDLEAAAAVLTGAVPDLDAPNVGDTLFTASFSCRVC